MDFTYKIKKLTDSFYQDYPSDKYPEILSKKNRGYNCILYRFRNDYFVCLPFRTEISHKYSYHFQNTIRSIHHKSGIDYTKMIIINDESYFSNENCLIDSDEYTEMIRNIDKIVIEAELYLNNYINHHKGNSTLSKQEYRRAYNYSPLKYFHNIIIK